MLKINIKNTWKHANDAISVFLLLTLNIFYTFF